MRLIPTQSNFSARAEDVFWTLGKYDIVAVVEAPDDISITALGLSSGALGNVRTQTLRALTQADVKTGKVVMIHPH
jgi:uncharacterized protein with GYD domain